MDTALDRIASARAAQRLVQEEFQRLNQMLYEGIYELTFRTRTQTLILPLPEPLRGQVAHELREDAYKRYQELEKEIEDLQKDVLDEQTFARDKERAFEEALRARRSTPPASNHDQA